MSVADLEALEESVFWLSQAGLREDLATAHTEAVTGGGMTEIELRASIGDDLKAEGQ